MQTKLRNTEEDTQNAKRQMCKAEVHVRKAMVYADINLEVTSIDIRRHKEETAHKMQHNNLL